MLEHTEEIIEIFIRLILPLIGIRLILDYTRMLLFKEWFYEFK